MKNKLHKNNYNPLIILPLVLAICITPLLARYVQIPYDMTGFYFIPDKTATTDFFTYYKSLSIITAGGLSIIFLFIFRKKYHLLSKENYKYLFPLGGYLLFVLLSWIFSPYKLTATIGYIERYEGSLVLISYIAILIYSFMMMRDEKLIILLLKLFGITVFLLCLLGLTQFLGHDFLQTNLGKSIMLPKAYWAYKDEIQFTFQNNEVYQTLYNTNYISSFMSFVLPLLIIGGFYVTKKVNKMVIILLYSLVLLNIFGSRTASSIISLCIIITLSLIVLNKRLIVCYKTTAIYFFITICVANIFTTTIKNEINNAKTEQLTFSPYEDINSLYCDNNKVFLTYKNASIVYELVSFNQDQVQITASEEGITDLPIKSNNKGFYYAHKKPFNEINFRIAEIEDDSSSYGLQFIIAEIQYNFKIINGNLIYLNTFGKETDLNPAESFLFEGKERLGSGRGYIWSRSIPLIKDNLIYGEGADTFVYRFPHNDVISKLKSGFPRNTVVDKPHNMYLGIAVNTGLLSLIFLIVFWSTYIYFSIHTYVKIKHSMLIAIVHTSIFIGFISYMVLGLVNDSSVAITPLLWTFIGIDLAIIAMIRQNFLTKDKWLKAQ